MAEDDDSIHKSLPYKVYQETFQRSPETQSDHRYPSRSAGVVPLPPGSRGPRSLYLRKHGDSFGFTLRHFIVYPPTTIQETINNRHAAAGTLLAPMDTIFVKNVFPNSPAEQAGLQHGDRIVAVNGDLVNDKSYKQVVQLIQHSPEYLHLLVVSKEDDVLQKFFSETAHNPISNQNLKPDRRRLLRSTHPTHEFHADDTSWKSLQDAPIYSTINPAKVTNRQQQRSADNLLRNSPKEFAYYDQISHVIDDPSRRRAQPQVPVYRKMGRRASEGSTFSNKDLYQNFDTSSVSTGSNEMVVGGTKMKSSAKATYPEPRANENMQTFNYPNTIGCRLSLDDGGRRQSTSSLSSSVADGSKDSLSSYDSVSTLTGQDVDDSVLMTRLRKNLQQKEEFLRRPSHPVEGPTIQREFYGRPKKLEKSTWPPNEPVRQDSPSRTAKPVHQNFQRVKTDIDSERDLGIQSPTDNSTGHFTYNAPTQRGANSPKDWQNVSGAVKMKEATEAPSALDYPGDMNGALTMEDEDRRLYLTNLQMVSKRTKQFESGRPLPEDDPMLKDRTSFYKSELARLSSKRVVPHVTIRAHEFESRSSEPRRDTSGSSTNTLLRRQHRDSRSLDSSGSNASSSSINEVIQSKLSGNVIIPFGSKYIHVPPPAEYRHTKDMQHDLDNHPVKMRVRSNSADSWTSAMQAVHKEEQEKTFLGQSNKMEEDVARDVQEAIKSPSPVPKSKQPVSPLIPEPVEHLQINPTVAIIPATPPILKPSPVRPNQLDLGSPVRPLRKLQLSLSGESSPVQPSSPVNSEEQNAVVVRRVKNTSLADEERAMRRESYLKATGNGRMHVEEFSDGEISPQIRRGSLSGGSSSSVSLERDRSSIPSSPLEKERQVVKEGPLYCKIAEIDGKRAADRSWKQVWIVLKGQKLYIYKDRQHQSPSDAAEQSLANGVDMSASCVRIAEDYTKRKNVLRVSSVLPCRSELLLQADSPVDLADWVKALQEQVGATDIESKSDGIVTSKQQAVPQTIPASTTVQVQGSSRLSPQPNKSKLPSLRNRSPTGQSPVSKTRKPSQVNEGLTSPKSKTWKGRVAKQFRKIQGASSPSSPTAPEVSTFGVPLEHCYPSNYNPNVPRLVEVCTEIVESKGLDIIGVYRVPGNSAAITALTNSINQSFEGVPIVDAQWNDVHVVSSLLKSFFRKLPDALLTSGLYSNFIEADKAKDPNVRMEELRKLVRCLPPHHYHTLRHLMLHLKKVTDNSEVNKMEGRNLAIVFGPTLIRAVQDDMATLVNDMTHNYKIVESLICYADWFFSEESTSSLNLTSAPPVDSLNNELDVASNRALLLDNISKVEGIKGDKVPGRELLSSIISAAHRKMRKGGKTTNSGDMKDDLITPIGMKEFTSQSNFPGNHKQNLTEGKSSDIPTTIVDIEKSNPQMDRGTYFNYSDQENYRRRIKNFIQETEANLQRNRKTAEFYSDNFDQSVPRGLHNMNQENKLTSTSHSNFGDAYAITKTQSASNVFYSPMNGNSRHSANSVLTVQFNKNSRDIDNNTQSVSLKNSDRSGSFDFNQNKERRETTANSYQNSFKKKFSDSNNIGALTCPKPFDKAILRRGSSVENVNTSIMDLSSNGTLKKVKYANENDLGQRTGSLDSLHKAHDADDGGDLQSTIMKIFDEKKKTLNPLLGTDLPFADESPERPAFDSSAYQNKENIPASPKLYRNPSLHKSTLSSAKFAKLTNRDDFNTKELEKGSFEEEKDKDCSENVPDNERHISTTDKLTYNIITKPNAGLNFLNGNSKLRRSESLNKPDRTVSPPNYKLKRSESLNKASDRLKRSDSLTKNEKTENNLNKRRELSASARRTTKEFTKLKRKNGMPERSIKRRHTVGGTKDFDKVNWLDNRYQEEDSGAEKCNKEKCTLRTSSPDLSSTRRERLLFEVNLVGPENMVVALRQHLIGARPQSLPEPRIFNVPLESHV
ncbi:uncharacterized protein LOC116177335 isoform X3 [Photinus pyralis]|uniref:uncharacterized protein LOC116177335 isoform X3 n=1 Tax=Photinus pyralis TaxID=7054 RepID=UPI0012675B72|nr:uncharacterized protein LOC116177335 isoform X3 [Photinus pyralis]